MIKINLTPNSSASVVSSASAFAGGGVDFGADDNQIKRQALVKFFVVLLPVIALYAYEYVTIPDLEQQLRSKRNLLRELKATNDKAKGAVDEIEKFKKDKDRLQLQIDTLEGLASDRLKEVKILDAIQKDIPERVWLTRVETKGDQMTIKGFSTADVETTNFMESLSKSIHLKDVRLVRSVEQQTDGSVYKVFDIAVTIDRVKVRSMGGAQ